MDMESIFSSALRSAAQITMSNVLRAFGFRCGSCFWLASIRLFVITWLRVELLFAKATEGVWPVVMTFAHREDVAQNAVQPYPSRIPVKKNPFDATQRRGISKQ